MTVFESLATWLWEILTDPANGFQKGEYIVDSEALPEWQGVINAAIFSNPSDIQRPTLGGRIRHESFKTFFARRNFIDLQTRMDNEAFFEKLRNCIYKKNLRAIHPQDGRKWREISYHGGVLVTQRAENNEHAIYQINLKLSFEE